MVKPFDSGVWGIDCNMFFMKMIFICFAFVVYISLGLSYLNVLFIYVTPSFILFLNF